MLSFFWYFLDLPPSYEVESIEDPPPYSSSYSGEVQRFICFIVHENFGKVLECEERGGFHTNEIRNRVIRNMNSMSNTRSRNTRRGTRWIFKIFNKS